jgi:hypothetical protein
MNNQESFGIINRTRTRPLRQWIKRNKLQEIRFEEAYNALLKEKEEGLIDDKTFEKKLAKLPVVDDRDGRKEGLLVADIIDGVLSVGYSQLAVNKDVQDREFATEVAEGRMRKYAHKKHWTVTLNGGEKTVITRIPKIPKKVSQVLPDFIDRAIKYFKVTDKKQLCPYLKHMVSD